MAITLKEATAVLLIDAMNNHQGNIRYDDVEMMSKARKTAFAFELMESDNFLMSVTSAIENVITEHLDYYADEYGIEE